MIARKRRQQQAEAKGAMIDIMVVPMCRKLNLARTVVRTVAANTPQSRCAVGSGGIEKRQL
jgi:hypothetical protein